MVDNVEKRRVWISAAVLLLTTLFATVPGAFATNVNGTISEDTTWDSSGSPFEFVGAVTVSAGATLTILPDTVVDLGGFRLYVDGSLQVHGAQVFGGTNSLVYIRNDSSGNSVTNSTVNLYYGISIVGSADAEINSNESVNMIRFESTSNLDVLDNVLIGSIAAYSGSATIEDNVSIRDVGVGGTSTTEVRRNTITGTVGVGANSHPTITNNTFTSQ